MPLNAKRAAGFTPTGALQPKQDSWARLVNSFTRSRKTVSPPSWSWPTDGVINTGIRPIAPPRSEDDNPGGGLIRVRVRERPRRFIDWRGQIAACANIIANGEEFRAIARGAAARELCRLPADAEIVAFLGSSVRPAGGIFHELTGETPSWVFIHGLFTHEPPPFPFFGLIGSGHGCRVVRFDSASALHYSRHFTDHEAATRFAIAFSKRCPEYQMDVVGFTKGLGASMLREQR
jgi:hypothetical protein